MSWRGSRRGSAHSSSVSPLHPSDASLLLEFSLNMASGLLWPACAGACLPLSRDCVGRGFLEAPRAQFYPRLCCRVAPLQLVQPIPPQWGPPGPLSSLEPPLLHVPPEAAPAAPSRGLPTALHFWVCLLVDLSSRWASPRHWTSGQGSLSAHGFGASGLPTPLGRADATLTGPGGLPASAASWPIRLALGVGR